MTAPQKPQQEPTMEEILASIRRIIADDNQAPAASEAAPPAAEDDVLELTQVVEEPPPRPAAEPPRFELPPDPEPEPAPEPVFERPRAPEPPAFEPPPFQPPPSEARPPEPPPATPVFDQENLLSAAAAAATGAAFAGLMGNRAPTAAPPYGGASDIGGKTVEDLVRELLRPMLKDWLDANLPDMAERLVRAEIDRVSRRFVD